MERPETPEPEPASGAPHERLIGPALEHIQQALRGLRFGEVTVIVQDGVVIQVERTERRRLDRPPKKR